MRNPLRVSLFMERGEWQTLQQLARVRAAKEKKDVTASVLVREAVRAIVERHGKRGGA